MSAAVAVAVTVAEPNPLHTISVLVRNQPGVLVRVALVFARRGYNIESLVVSPDPTDAGFSRMTITCRGAAETLQIAEHYKAKVVDCGPNSLILRVTGGSEKLDSFISLLRPFGLVELVRSGKILMTRGPETT